MVGSYDLLLNAAPEITRNALHGPEERHINAVNGYRASGVRLEEGQQLQHAQAVDEPGLEERSRGVNLERVINRLRPCAHQFLNEIDERSVEYVTSGGVFTHAAPPRQPVSASRVRAQSPSRARSSIANRQSGAARPNRRRHVRSHTPSGTAVQAGTSESTRGRGETARHRFEWPSAGRA